MYDEPNIDPAREYDIWCARQEEAYQARIAEATCEDCDNCVKPDERYLKNTDRLGYCKEMGEFVSLDDTPEEYDCEDFE